MKANKLAISIIHLTFLFSIFVIAEDITLTGGMTGNVSSTNISNMTLAVTESVANISNETSITDNESLIFQTSTAVDNQSVVSVSNETRALTQNVSSTALDKAKENEACVEQYECLLTEDGHYYFDCYYDTKEKKCKCFTGQFVQCKITNNYCSMLYECKESPLGNYYFDCYLDSDANNCKCFVGAFGRCRMEKSSVRTKPAKTEYNVTLNISQQYNQTIITLPLNETKKPAQNLPLKQILFGGVGTIIIILILVILVAVLVMRMRDTPDNNLRRARNFHRKAEALHEKGKEDSAKNYYALAEKFRRRALRKR